MVYDYSGVDPDAAFILQDMNARLVALEAQAAFLIVSHTVTLEGGQVLTYNLVPSVSG